MYLNRDAAKDFLDFTNTAMQSGWLSNWEYLERLVELKNMIHPLSTLHAELFQMVRGYKLICNLFDNDEGEELKELLEQMKKRDFPSEEKREKITNQNTNQDSNDCVSDRTLPTPGGENRDEDKLDFITDAPSKVIKSKWVFHQADRDYFPSIPHGHSDKDNRIKLDPYLRDIIDTGNNNTYLKKEDKNYIIGLWNDESFRDFARIAIQFYKKEYPDYKWRVDEKRILILPKKRKIRKVKKIYKY
ncbi:hypothetical protein [Paenibacillus gansuensis]|uniref:Uncharacterized protein n=1 Tax=Paenibacillus gansuensis TaxID=306542 RepID=A0ABW5PDX2_9BACL